MNKVDPAFANIVKKRAIMAMFSDDELMDQLVLKGGNLLNIVYDISPRASVDVDFSVEGELGDVEKLRSRIETTLKSTFIEIGFEVFDVNVCEVSPSLSDELKDYWGGYKIDFKIIERDKFIKWQGNLEQLQRNSAAVGKRGSTKFEIEISKYEFCAEKQALVFENLTIYAYTPLMVVAEKLRAICQQMPDYVKITKLNPSARSRDFVDIHTVAERFNISFYEPHVHEMISNVFAAKRVPLTLLSRISQHREFHRPDFEVVKATVSPDFPLRDFDFYFDFVLRNVDGLKSLWDE